MNENEHERLSNLYNRTQIKVRKQRCYCCSTLHSHIVDRYDNVTLSPLVFQRGLRIGPIQRNLSKLKFSFREYFNFLVAYVVITYYSLQFLSNSDTKYVLQYLFLPSRSISYSKMVSCPP